MCSSLSNSSCLNVLTKLPRSILDCGFVEFEQYDDHKHTRFTNCGILNNTVQVVPMFSPVRNKLNGRARCSSVVRASAHGAMGRHGVDPLSYISFQPVLNDWCNKVRGMCYPVCGMVHIKEPLLLMGKRSPHGRSGFPLSLSEWSFTICLTPYNRK